MHQSDLPDSRPLRKKQMTADKKLDHLRSIEWLHFFTVARKMCQVLFALPACLVESLLGHLSARDSFFGGIICAYGPNGGGKTTMFKTCLAIEAPELVVEWCAIYKKRQRG